MQQSTLRSFDVFDTLVLRRYAEPDHLHWMVGRRLKADGLIDMDERDWRQIRIHAEASCSAVDPDHDLAQVYREIARIASLDDAEAQACLAVELDEETRSIRPNVALRHTLTAMTRAGQAFFILSDTYFSKTQVADLLVAAGYDVPQASIHASSEAKSSKRAGTLYAGAVEHARAESRHLDHLGDNLRSDVLNARMAGADATWFLGSRANNHEEAMLHHAAVDCESSLVVGAARSARLAWDGKGNQLVWEVGASVAGPILTAFTLWVILDAMNAGRKRLYFLARDGQVLCGLAQRLCRWIGVDLDCRYLLASRQALYLPSLGTDVKRALDIVFAEAAGKAAALLLQELEFDAEAAKNLLLAANLQADTPIDSGSLEAERLRYVLLGDRLITELTERLTQQAQAFATFFEAQGFFDPVSKAMVDLGWHGNLQLRIDRATKNRENRALHGYYLGLHQCPAMIAAEVSTYTNLAGVNQNLLETFCLACHASIKRYIVDASGHSTGEGLDRPDQNALDWGVVAQQSGIYAFCDSLLEGLDRRLVSSDRLMAALRPAGLASLRDFTFYPSQAEATAFGSVAHAQDQTHKILRELGPRLHVSLLWTLLDSKRRRTHTLWIWGTIARSTSWPGRLLIGAIHMSRSGLQTSVRRHLRLTAYELLDTATRICLHSTPGVRRFIRLYLDPRRLRSLRNGL